MLMPWFDALREARIPVLGLFSVPLVLGKQTLGFAAGEKRFVVVTTSAGGLRQTFFDNGQMHFSRLTQLPNLQAETIASTSSKETAKTVQYLLGQRQITRGAALPVFVLAHSSHHAIFAAHCTNIGDIDYRLIDMQTFAGSVGYTGNVTGPPSPIRRRSSLPPIPNARFFAYGNCAGACAPPRSCWPAPR